MTRKPFSFDTKISLDFPKIQTTSYEVENIKIGANGGNAYAIIQPRLPFRLREVFLSPDYNKVDIKYVMIGNVIQTRFSKKCDTCIPGVAITVYLESFESNEVVIKVTIRGDEAIPE